MQTIHPFTPSALLEQNTQIEQRAGMKDTILLFPATGMGHLVSMVELGKLILHQYGHQFSITILLINGPFDPPAITSYVNAISQTHPSITFHTLPQRSVDTAPTRSRAAIAFEFLSLYGSDFFDYLKHLPDSSKPRAIVIDYFCACALPVAREFGIPVFHFFTSGAAVLGAYLYLPTMHEEINTTQSFKDLPDTLLRFPGFPPLPATQMPEPLLDRNDPAYDYIIYFSEHLRKSDGLLVNTFEALEPNALQVLADGSCVPKGTTPPVYCVGPLIANPDEGESQHACLTWLDSQPSKSVVFLCFGSRGSFSAEQVKEIAKGLENSGQRFLWVVKNPPKDNSKQSEEADEIDLECLMPEGFLERTRERGMVVKLWAPQVAVLKHPSVGGFVTHCGWNSVLEAVVRGVPMVAWPLYAEQHMNRALLVGVMKMAIAVEERDEDRLVTGEEVERSVRELMDTEVGRELRERSRKLREMAEEALGPRGTSAAALAKLAKLWSWSSQG